MKTMVDKDTLSYKKGFAKGIEIYTENLSKSGYDADEDNKRCVKAFKYYADTGFKKGTRLNDGQRQYFYGMAEGIEYKYKKGGTPLTATKKESRFEKLENEYYYGKPNYTKDIDDELFG